MPKRPLQSTVAKDDDLANSSTDKKADQFATQTDTPHESLIGTAPITTEHNATTAAARTEEAKHLAKPVSIEEVQDPEGPTTETSAVNNASKPEITNAAGDPPTPKGSKDLEMEDAKPSATKEPSQPGTTAAISELVDGEPKTGVKRKATESPITNRDANPEVKEAEVSAKKQKGSPIKNVINKVGAAVKKVGRPKKDQTQKKNPAPIGQTARRTRSQAKADAV